MKINIMRSKHILIITAETLELKTSWDVLRFLNTSITQTE